MTRPLSALALVLALFLPVPASAAPATVAPVTAQILLGTPMPDLQLSFPQDAAVTWFVSTFGVWNRGHPHEGIDLHAPKGTPVYAAAAGVVTRMESSPRAGLHVFIDHGAGWETWYMHLDDDTPGTDDGLGGAATAFAPGLAVGDFVDAGQLIGFVGDSGNAEWTVPHTHFEVHHDGRVVDPYPMLVEAQNRALLTVRAQWLAVLADQID